MAGLKALCKDRFEAFGTAGQAARIEVAPLAVMAKRYAAGSLAQIFSHPAAA
jgi:fructose-bisphosphate aldolase class II